MKKTVITFVVGVVAFILSTGMAWLAGYSQAVKKSDTELKAIHSRYLKIYPFEGDTSYEDFDYIFGQQDDEFYPNNTK